ncbi:hypothetical protein FA95DRAFT_1479383, partial [Auriscalpium vulgare]
MMTNHLNWLNGLKAVFLGRQWQLERNMEFTEMYFRQKGHERELPEDYLQRRIMYARALLNTDLGGPEEAQIVLRNVPAGWMTTLNVPLPLSTDDITQRAQDNSASLIAAARSSGEVVSREDVQYLVRQALRDENSRPFRPRTFRNRPNRAQASVNLAAGSSEDVEETGWEVVNEDDEDSKAADEVNPEVLAQAFATLAKRQRAPPKGGYPFPKADGTKSLLRPPPSPCKLCGSKHHWDRECPHWPTYAKKKEVNFLSAGLETERSPEEEPMYHNLYESYLMQSISS